MKRWDIKFEDCVMKLYYQNYETAKERNPKAVSITENFDISHIGYCYKIGSAAEEILYDYRGREVYKIPYNGSYILVRLWIHKDENGDKYFLDGCEYQEHVLDKLVKPITWTCSDPKEFYEKFLSYAIQDIKVECQRKYGQPKLKKPKVCNNKNLIGSVDFTFGEKPVRCKVWKENNVVYVLHRDWFSDCISFDEAEKRGMINTRKQKFLYNDNFGGVVLRNEAVLSFGIPNSRHNLVKQFSKMMGVEWTALPSLHRWEDFFGDVLELCGGSVK